MVAAQPRLLSTWAPGVEPHAQPARTYSQAALSSF